jgi:hypothetical protein
MNPDEQRAYARKRLAILARQELRMLKLARQPGLSDKTIRLFCRVLFHFLCCRQIILAGMPEDDTQSFAE